MPILCEKVNQNCKKLNKNNKTVPETLTIGHIQLQAELGITSEGIWREAMSSKGKIFAVMNQILNIFKTTNAPLISCSLSVML